MRIASLCSSLFVAFFLAAACSSGSSSSTASPNCTGPCPKAVALKCTFSPPSESDCESGCAQIRASNCGSKWDALFSCGGSNPQYKCDSKGYVTIAGCETLSDALYSCLSGGGSGGSPAIDGGGGSGGSPAIDGGGD